MTLALLMNLGFAGSGAVVVGGSSNIVRSFNRTRKRPMFYDFFRLEKPEGLKQWKPLSP